MTNKDKQHMPLYKAMGIENPDRFTARAFKLMCGKTTIAEILDAFIEEFKDKKELAMASFILGHLTGEAAFNPFLAASLATLAQLDKKQCEEKIRDYIDSKHKLETLHI